MLNNLSKAMAVVVLDAVMQQQKLLAQNVASISDGRESVGYVSFEDVMNELSGEVDSPAGISEIGNGIVNGEYDRYSKESVEAGLDQQLAKMTTNVVQYKALLTALSKHGAIMRTVIDSQR